MELSNIVNSIDSALEKNRFYDNSKFDELLDSLNKQLKIFETTSIVKNLPLETSFIVDRFESDFAVCENQIDGKMYNIHKSIVDPNAKEGVVLKRCGDIYLVDSVESNQLCKESKK